MGRQILTTDPARISASIEMCTLIAFHHLAMIEIELQAQIILVYGLDNRASSRWLIQEITWPIATINRFDQD